MKDFFAEDVVFAIVVLNGIALAFRAVLDGAFAEFENTAGSCEFKTGHSCGIPTDCLMSDNG